MVDVCNSGVPLVERSPRAAITQSLAQLAAVIAGDGPVPRSGAGKTQVESPRGRWRAFWPSDGARR